MLALWRKRLHETGTHDANGNTVTKTVNGQTTSFSYDARDRLTGILLPDGKVITYTYDPFGRRVSKNVNGTITHYIYSDEGLIGEYATDGTAQKTYTWQPDSTWGTNPVTQTIGNNTYYYHNDHLGTPQKLTDESGTVVWSATYSAFGKATVTTATITNNLRYPGQYYDEEIGLHYNWQRYYDPAEGRYVSVDPIGFEAGDENLYRYVGNRTSTLFDYNGLEVEPYWLINVEKGREAHKLFDQYIQKNFNTSRYVTNSSLRKIFEDMRLSLDRPDLVDVQGNKIWELKTFNYEVYNKVIPKTKRQPEKYVCELQNHGYDSDAGDVMSIIKWSGHDIGYIVVRGKKYKMRLYAGKAKGLILYSLDSDNEQSRGERELIRALNKGPSTVGGGVLFWWQYVLP